MDGQSSTPKPMPPLAGPVFVAPRADHTPPEGLSDDALETSIRSLRHKVHWARRRLHISQGMRLMLTVAVLGAGFTVLWLGPEPILQKMTGQRVIATMYDVFIWWFLVVALGVIGGAFGDQVLRGRSRRTRGWKHRVAELTRRLEDAEDVRRRRGHG